MIELRRVLSSYPKIRSQRVAPSTDPGITGILVAMRDEPARREELAESLYRHTYPHLRELAGRLMASERGDHTLQPTALVNEAYLRLVDSDRVDWEGRSHFFCIAARIMRRILIDHARGRARAKRGGEWRRVTLHDQLHRRDFDALELLVLEDTLQELERRHPRMARVVELRVFGGMTMKEIAHVLGVSKRTVDEDWSFARRWLAREFANEEQGER